MTFDEICLPDMSLESIHIEYDKAVITTYDYEYKYGYIITCTSLAGVTDLNVWDENIIINASLKPVGLEDEFVKQWAQACPEESTSSPTSSPSISYTAL